MDDNRLHDLIPKWRGDETARLKMRREFRWDGVIEETCNTGDVNGEADKHKMIIMFYNAGNGG